MSCFFCSAACDTVVNYFTLTTEQPTRTGCCAHCLKKKVAVPLGYSARVVKGRARRVRSVHRKERQRPARVGRPAPEFEPTPFAHDAAVTQLATIISCLYSLEQ